MNIDRKILSLYSTDLKRNFTINGIAKKLGKPYGTVYNAIQELSRNKVLLKEQKGKATLCSLNFYSDQVQFILSGDSIEKKEEFKEKNPVLANALNELSEKLKEKLNHNVISLILFGSQSQGKATRRSDVDLLIIVPDKAEADKAIHQECSSLEMRYGRAVNPVIVTPEMFVNMIKEKGKNVGKEVLRGNVVFSGFEKFWELVIEGVR